MCAFSGIVGDAANPHCTAYSCDSDVYKSSGNNAKEKCFETSPGCIEETLGRTEKPKRYNLCHVQAES